MSDTLLTQRSTAVEDTTSYSPPPTDEERPPSCPSCQRRLVILTTQGVIDAAGQRQRRQLWGCPRGHATAHRMCGRFTPVELLPDVCD